MHKHYVDSCHFYESNQKMERKKEKKQKQEMEKDGMGTESSEII